MHAHYERMTRQELYDLVWSTPIVQLSERFGLSGRGLAKFCARHEVPVPERGWWAKLAAGHPVRRLPLPKATQPHKEHVELWVSDDWRKYLDEEEHEWFATKFAEEGREAVPVLREDESRHTLIVQARRSPKPGSLVRGRFAVNVSKDLLPRALRLAAAFVESCEQRGYAFSLRNGETGAVGVVIRNQQIGVAIEEPYVKTPHVLTKKEAREKALGRGWRIPDFDSVRGGQLAFVLDHPINGERRSFGGKPDYPLEASFPEIFKSLLRVAMRMTAETHYRAEQALRDREAVERRAAAERQRREEAARLAEERRRRRELLRQSARLRRSKEVLDLMGSVLAAAAARAIPQDILAEWLTVAQSVADDLNPTDAILDAVTPASSDRKAES